MCVYICIYIYDYICDIMCISIYRWNFGIVATFQSNLMPWIGIRSKNCEFTLKRLGGIELR